MKLALAPLVVLLAREGWAADGALSLSLSEEAVAQARKVLERGIEAVGGLEALQGLDNISRVLEGFRVEVGQSHRPDTPYSRQPLIIKNVLDLKAGRSFEELKTAVIGGLQVHGAYVNRDNSNGFQLDYSARLRRPLAPAALSRGRATPNRYPEHLLRAAWSRLPTLRWLGEDSYLGELQHVVGFSDAYGNALALYFSARTGLLTKSETLLDEPVFSLWGERSRDHIFSDYRLVNGLKIPFRFTTRYAGELLEELTAKEVQVNVSLAEGTFEPPPGFEDAPPPPARGSTTRLAEGVHVFHSGYNSLFVGLKDYVLVIEAPLNDGLTQLALAKVRELFPGKPIRYVVATHFHRDHIGGLRGYAAEGVTLVATPLTKLEIDKLLRAERPVTLDSLSRRPRTATVETVLSRRIFSDGERTVELYDIGPSPHVAELLIAYLPTEKILYVADVLDINPGQVLPAPDDMADFSVKLERLKLEPETLVPTHGIVGTMTYLREALSTRTRQ